MNETKQKLHLKKQFAIGLPITFVIVVFVIGLVIFNNSKKFTNEVKSNNQRINNSLIIEDENYIKSENKYINLFAKNLEMRKRDNTIIYYAQKFRLDVDKTLELAYTLTDGYQSEDYNTNYIIAPDNLKKSIKAFTNEEAGIAYFVRDLYRYPERYGFTIEEIRLSETPEVEKKVIDGTVYLDNGLTYEQYLGRLCDLYGIDKSIALAISYHETGVLTSGLFNYSNNVGGQRGYAGWMSYTTLEAGILGYVISLRSIIDQNGIDLTNPNGIYELSSIYVNGHKGNPSAHWASKVTYFRDKINTQDLFTIK